MSELACLELSMLLWCAHVLRKARSPGRAGYDLAAGAITIFTGPDKRSTAEDGSNMRDTIFKPFLALLIVATTQAGLVLTMPASAGVPGSHSQVNLDANGVALGGYDPVAYFDGRKPTHGVAAIFASYAGAHYLFATAAHRNAFLANPKKYVPEFGGFCAVGTSFGEKVDVEPETGEVVNGKLYLNNNQRALDIFNKDPSGTITKAESKWPTVKDKAL